MRITRCWGATARMRGAHARPKWRTAVEILGPIDAIKFRSSMTLFEAARPAEGAFAAAFETFFAGEADPETLTL